MTLNLFSWMTEARIIRADSLMNSQNKMRLRLVFGRGYVDGARRNRKIHGGDKKRHTCDYRLSTFKRQPSIGFSIPASNNDGHDFYNAGKSNYGYAGSGFHLRI